MALAVHSPIDGNPTSEDAVNFSAMAEAFFSAANIAATLSCVVELATSTVNGCEYAGVFLLEESVLTTPAFTDPKVVELDALQLRTGQGPSLDAISHRLTVYTADMANDLRWLRFAPYALGLGIHSILALPLDSSSQLGSLTLSARQPAAFDVIDRAKASLLASLAGIALSVARHEDGRGGGGGAGAGRDLSRSRPFSM